MPPGNVSFGPGTLVAGGKYRVERVLGRGGMGVVVAATHVQLQTTFALKFLDETMAKEPKATARFLREARACAQLRSENICRVSDFGMEGAMPFIVMELLEGMDLGKLIRSRSLDVATSAQYVIQVCAGLAEAHAARIIHRDLKPSNLFVTRRPDGSTVIKILDFGVAKTEGTDAGITATSHVVGSPGFMAPEQIRSSKTVDGRADIWSLGIILYRLVSGRQPFKASSFAEFALAIVRDTMPALPEAPATLTPVIARCLEKDPENRFRDVMELAAALAPFASATRPSAMPTPATPASATPALATIMQPAPAPTGPLPRPTPRPGAATATLLDGSGMHQVRLDDRQVEDRRVDAAGDEGADHEFLTQVSEAMSAQIVPSEDLAPGTIVGEYRIERKIGQGGMGVVYAAIHPLIGKHAAIKVISAGLGTDSSTVQRFVVEARSVNQIGHPNIVDVFAFGNLPDGRNYFVMEHLRGESLRERLARSGLTLGDSLEILDEIAGALEAAHEKQIVHRDLKPDNIFLAAMRGGRIMVKLLDFGIAKLAVADGFGPKGIAKTRTGMMMGTPAYLSPEQARGTNVGYATDIYALGCMTFEMACGRLPFVGTSAMDIVLMHIEQRPQRPSELWPAIPPALEQLILQMLDKVPHKRPTLPEIRAVFTELVLSGAVAMEHGTGTFRSELRARRASEAPSYRTPAPDTEVSHAVGSAVLTPPPGPPPVAVPAPMPPVAIVATVTGSPPGLAPASPRPRRGLAIGLGMAALIAVLASIAIVVATRGGGAAAPQAGPPATKPAPSTPSPQLIATAPPDAAVAAPPDAAVAAPSQPPGIIAIRVNVADPHIEVDGVAIAVAGGAAKLPQSVGSHHVVITAAGYVPYDTTVHVDGEATVTLDVKLDKLQPRKRPTAHPGTGSRTGSGTGSSTAVKPPNLSPKPSGDGTIDPF